MGFSPPESNGWMECAIQIADSRFFAAMISDDSDGVVRFHIDRDTKFETAELALAHARWKSGLYRYRSFKNVYAIIEVNK